jgi:putative CocE/NonD family hydrolase
MRDGTRLAVTLFLPLRLERETRLPAVLIKTRYWRRLELAPPLNRVLPAERLSPRTSTIIPFLTSHGYALLYIDERGTGASFGQWPYPWADQTLEDMHDLVEWVIRQPWSSGMVGALGVSYLGSTAELFAALGHPAVKAVVPMYNHPDPYTDIAYPGGLFNQRFIRAWGEFDRYLDRNQIPPEFGRLGRWLIRGVQPVDGDRNKSLLFQAVQEHASNGSMFHRRFSIRFRDEPVPPVGISMEDMSVRRFNDRLASSATAIFGWGSWLDAGTGDAALRRARTFPNTGRTVIGAWDHGGLFHASPFQPPRSAPVPPTKGQLAEIVLFLDAHLKAAENGVRDAPTFYYYTLGKERWQRASHFPPSEVQDKRWYLSENGVLLPDPPEEDAAADFFRVDFSATTGTHNRWWELAGMSGAPIIYAQRREAARHMLTYTTPPLEQDLEIAGYPIVNLKVTSSHPDGAFFVYLELVDRDGQVTYLTEGQLRGLHRKVSPEPQPYNIPVPYHTYKQADAMPLEPGQVAELAIALLPVSVYVRRGQRLRLGLAGHDADTFQRLPESGFPELLVHRSSLHPSWLTLPILAT